MILLCFKPVHSSLRIFGKVLYSSYVLQSEISKGQNIFRNNNFKLPNFAFYSRYYFTSTNFNKEGSNINGNNWVLGASAESKRPQTESYTHPDVVAAYNSGRPAYPTEIIERILNKRHSEKIGQSVALDVGCGSGQFSRILAPHFNKVIGIDPSPPQVDEAKRNTTENNVEYRVGTCTHLDVPKESVDVITVATALHRFTELDKFYREVDRCLKRRGILIYFGFFVKMKEPLLKANKIVGKFVYGEDYLGLHWSPEVKRLIVDEYTTTPRLYPLSEGFQIVDTSQYTISKIVQLVKSLEPYGVLKDKNPSKLDTIMNSMINELKSAFPSTDNDSLEGSFDFQSKFVGYICQKS